MADPTSKTPAIELLVDKVELLFDPLDPMPIPSRDLARGAEDFIVGWARELPRDAPLRILAHLSEPELEAIDAATIKAAIARHFSYRAERTTGDLHELFRIGRVALVIGLAVLAACVIGGRLIQAFMGEGPVTRFFSEGLIILGWVANWRPLEIFLYDWWPLVRRRRLYRRLAAATIEFKPYASSRSD